MKVSKIIINQIMGVDHIEITPGKITKIKGRNRSGKSSVLEAIKNVLQGGHDVRLIRNGADKGEVVLLLDDGVEISKSITEKGSSLSITHPTLGKVSRGQTYLDKLVDVLSINPVEFLTAKPADRIRILLEAMPIMLADGQIETATGMQFEYDKQAHPLIILQAIEKAVYDERKQTNAVLKNKRITAQELASTLPAESAQDVRADLETAEKKLAIGIKQENQEIAQKREEFSQRRESTNRTAILQKSGLQNEMQQKLDDIRKEYQPNINAIDPTPKLEQLRKSEAEALRTLDSAWRPELERINTAIAEKRALLKEFERVEATRNLIERTNQQADALKIESDNLNAGLSGLAALRESLVKNLPLKGVTIEDGQIYRNGVVYEHLSESERVTLALEIAQLRTKDLALILVDGMECLDSASFAELEKQAEAMENYQFIVARVEDSDLKVEAK